jgi:hypothetical protein
LARFEGDVLRGHEETAKKLSAEEVAVEGVVIDGSLGFGNMEGVGEKCLSVLEAEGRCEIPLAVVPFLVLAVFGGLKVVKEKNSALLLRGLQR